MLVKFFRLNQQLSYGVNKTMEESKQSNNINLCACGCGKEISIPRFPCLQRKYIRGHNSKMETHPSWKGGIEDTEGYKVIIIHDHPFADKRGRVRLHRYIMEEYLGRYLQPDEIVHHINEIRDDNRIENLILLSNRRKHNTIHHKKDMSDRFCLKCKSDKTYIEKNGVHKWYKYQDSFICKNCYNKKYSKHDRFQ